MILALTLWLSSFTGFEVLPIRAQIRAPLNSRVCLEVVSEVYYSQSCFIQDRPMVERKFNLDAGDYSFIAWENEKISAKREVIVLSSK